MINSDTVKTLAKRTVVLVLVADIIHCYRFISNYYNDEEVEEEDDEETKRIIAQYNGDCSPDTIVSKQEFDTRVQQALEHYTRGTSETDSVKRRLSTPMIKVERESIVFAGGGRATFLQLAHPFIAAGIRDHSYLQRGVSRRFFNTFKYVFGMNFGVGQEIVQASKAVRGLHAKVNGEIGEEVGVFSSKSKFDANQKEAMRYVQWTLVETAVFEYELLVGCLSEEEKNEIARSACKFLLLFGVPEQPGETEMTWKQFKRRANAVYRSKLITVGDTALDTAEYLLLPPAPMYAPAMNFVKYYTLISLPPKLGLQYGGRYYNTWVDKLVFAVSQGLIRFQYRLCPGSFRYLGAYWTLYEHAYGSRGFLSRFFSSMSAALVKMFLAMMMPERDPEKAVAMVKAIRSQQQQHHAKREVKA